jgi:hypothetical protein
VWAIALAVFFVCAAHFRAAWAETAPAVTVRFAAHDHYDRLVFTLPKGAAFSSTQDGTALKLRLTGAGPVAAQAGAGQRMLGFDAVDGDITIHMAPHTHPHVWQKNSRVVVDVNDDQAPSADASAAPPLRVLALRPRKLQVARDAEQVPAPPALAPLTPVFAENLAPEAAARSAGPPPPAAATPDAAGPSVGGAIDVGPVVQAQSRAVVSVLPQDETAGGPAILVPFGPDTGAAAFGRGGEGHVVFDRAQAADLGQLKDDPVWGAVTERVLPDGVDLRMKLPAGGKFLLTRRHDGWVVALVHALPEAASIAAHAEHGVLSLAAAAPGQVVVLDDEATGGKLLVGAQRAAGQCVPLGHQSAEFALLPSWQGVVVAPASDRISLAPLKDGFRLMASSGPQLSLLWTEGAGRVMTRHFDLPDLPEAVLRNRLLLATRDAALTPLLSRFPARLRMAQAMLAEGLDVEARAVLHAATSDDPAHADDADAAGLAAIASWLVARAGGAYPPPPDGFNPATLGDSDEAQFWQALLNGGQKAPAGPAASLAITWPMLQHYPAALRRRIAPAVGEILSHGGQDKALAAFLAAFPDPSLDLTRAELLQRQGNTRDALALLDAVGKRPDRLMRASAERAAVELRLATGKMDVEAAEAALGRQLYAWRGGPGDLALRMRVAALRAQAGHWRQALALLRETEGLFPEAHPQLHAAETQLVSDLLAGDRASRLSALDLVALAEEAGPLLSAADADVTLAPVLVDKLLALDLPARAETILRHLYDSAASPVQKAELGVRLAGLLADRGDAKGALDILDASADSVLDSRLVTQRGLLRARLLAQSGRESDALGILSGMQGDAATLLQAHILEDRHDWAEAAKLLESLIGTPSFAGKSDQAQRDMILRLANDESQAGDMTALRRLRSTQGARFASGPGADLFAVLTEEPVLAVDDLPRAGRELQAVRALPASLATH